jgi:hypothetical protein
MTDKEQKRKLKGEFKAAEQRTLENSMPLSKSNLKALLDFLNEFGSPCDHSLVHTTEFLKTHSLDSTKIIPWLKEHGGHCDCEVLGNVEDEFRNILGLQ